MKLMFLGLALAMALVLPSGASAQDPQPLTQESFSETAPQATGECDTTQPSSFAVSSQGVATGTYPGSYSLTETFTLGPPPGPNPFLNRPVTAFSASFTITSGDTVITGTEVLTSRPGVENKGSCNPGPPTTVGIVQALCTYEATIVSPLGTVADSGQCGVDLAAQDVFGGSFLHDDFNSDAASPAPVDGDGDGVADAIDTGAGTFDDHGGTSGAIVDSAGLTVLVEDAPAPDGVHVTVSGSGTARAVFSACGFSTIRLSAGSDLVLTCGSVKLKVTAGSAQVVLGGGITTVSVGAGSAAEVSDQGGGTFAIHNTGSGPVSVTTNGVTSTLTANQSSTSHVVTIANLCGLTKIDVQGSSKYAALTARQKQTVDALANAACAVLQKITPKLTARQKADLITLFKAAIQGLVPPGWLSQAQGDGLKSLAGTL